MPQDEAFWNPFRWVQAGPTNPPETPRYRHRFDGAAGRIECRLTALTPLIVGDGKRIRIDTVYFNYRSRHRPHDIVIPGTSLKGAIRSVAETISGSAGPRDTRAEAGVPGACWRLDTVARMFGYLEGNRAFAGFVGFSDGVLLECPRPWNEWPRYTVAVGQPKEKHRSFYPTGNRKFYHHHTETKTLQTAPPGIKQITNVRPAPPETSFSFTVSFEQLSAEELALLLYTLVLEETACVTLGTAALGRDAGESLELRGPLRHKLGGCKAQGAGSVRIEVQRVRWIENLADRYRGSGGWTELEGQSLQAWITEKIKPLIQRRDATMEQFRAMTIYSPQDPRTKSLAYPDYGWFVEERGKSKKKGLKPTL